MKKILLLNGPNLNLLGVREPDVYGTVTLEAIECAVAAWGVERGAEVDSFQSNHEGSLVDRLHAARGVYDGIIYNPGAHTHYSYALRDAVSSIDVPTVEVHLSNVDEREPFRRVSVVAPACVAQVKGRGMQGYLDALDILLDGVAEKLGEGYECRYAPGEVIVAGRGECAQGDAPTAAKQEGGQVLNAIAQLVAPGAALNRIERMCTALVDRGMQSFYVRGTSNIAWLTAFDDVFDDEEAHSLLVAPQDATLHTDSRYAEAARKAASAEQVISVDDERVSHAAFAARALFRDVDGLVGGDGATEMEAAVDLGSSPLTPATAVLLGIEDSMTLADYRALEKALSACKPRPCIEETSSFVMSLRAVKDASEVARMRVAQAITDAAFAHIVAFMRPGMTEREVQVELEDYMVRHGAEGLAFPSIVATGANGASPHAIPGQTRLEAGQCVVLDFGARAHGYCSDMTRMVFLGQPDARLREAYTTIRRANEQVQATLRPGVTGAAMHELAEEVLAEGGFAGAMGHGLGHGVGIDIHEEPNLSPRNLNPLVEGNVVTVEPGIYFPGEFGMRLEDFGVITHDGFAVFTQSSHEMVII